uniref:Uncharacterized protein n=1 Tax=Plectus sambesii TaxID=2011161 RepID=A0A914WK90_9BILA
MLFMFEWRYLAWDNRSRSSGAERGPSLYCPSAVSSFILRRLSSISLSVGSSVVSMDGRFVVVLLALAATACAAPAADPEKVQLQQLQLNGKLKSIQEQLSQLQAQLKESEATSAVQPGPQIAGNPSKTEASVAGAVKAEVDPRLAQVDSRDENPEAAFVEGSMGQEEVYLPRPVPRQIGWQPMKRRVGWQPMKKAVGWQPFKRDEEGAPFSLTMKVDPDLRDEMLQAVEKHLIEDLTVAQNYGIQPQQILADLRERNAARRQQRSWMP